MLISLLRRRQDCYFPTFRPPAAISVHTFILEVWSHLINSNNRVFGSANRSFAHNCLACVKFFSAHTIEMLLKMLLRFTSKCHSINLWVQVKMLFYYHFHPLTAFINFRGRELTASVYFWVNTADDVENERIGELPLELVRKAYDFYHSLKLLKNIFKLFYLSSVAPWSTWYWNRKPQYHTTLGVNLWQAYKSECWHNITD